MGHKGKDVTLRLYSSIKKSTQFRAIYVFTEGMNSVWVLGATNVKLLPTDKVCATLQSLQHQAPRCLPACYIVLTTPYKYAYHRMLPFPW